MQELEKKREKQAQAKEKKERAPWRKRKAAVKPLRHWEDMTQRVVNDYIRERDHDLPCISCGTFETVQWEAGHYRSRGKASHLRYNEDNIHKQCHHCNVQMSGNQQQYRIALVEKIGAERVEALENNNTPHRYTIEELEGIRRHYSALRRALTNNGGCMKITYSDEGAYSRIWLTGPFWQLAMARRIADAGLDASPVNTWESRGITFQITLYGKERVCAQGI